MINGKSEKNEGSKERLVKTNIQGETLENNFSGSLSGTMGWAIKTINYTIKEYPKVPAFCLGQENKANKVDLASKFKKNDHKTVDTCLNAFESLDKDIKVRFDTAPKKGNFTLNDKGQETSTLIKCFISMPFESFVTLLTSTGHVPTVEKLSKTVDTVKAMALKLGISVDDLKKMI